VKRAALPLLVRLRADKDAIHIAEELLRRHPGDVFLWRALFLAAERAGLNAKAVRAGEQLLKLGEKDADLEKRVKIAKKNLA
jgi:DNA-binding SARP family transcriptional activator